MADKVNLDELEDTLTTDEKSLDRLPDLDEGVYEDDTEPDATTTSEPDKDSDIVEDSVSVLDEDELTEQDESAEDSDMEDDSDDNDTVEVENTSSESTEPITIDVDGKVIQLDSTDELKELTTKALKDKTLYDSFKDDISILEGLKEEGIEEEDLYLLAEAKKGNPKAIAKLLKKTGIDPMDIDPEDEEVDQYKPKEVKADMRYIQSKKIIEDIKSNEVTATKFDNLIMKEFDESSRELVFKDPNNLQFVAELTKTGLIDEILPEYTKLKLLGKANTSFEALVKAYDTYVEKVSKTNTNKVNKVKEESKMKATKRKKASVGVKSKKSTKPKEKSINEMTDKEFEEYYKRTVGGYSFAI